MSIAETARPLHSEGAGLRNPRPVITGVTPPQTHTNPDTADRVWETAEGDSAAFDWYAATVPNVRHDDVVEGLADFLNATIEEGRPLHGYTMGFELVTVDGIAAHVLAGGPNGAPHAWASGAFTAGYVEAVRALWPARHRVSRMDSRIDFGGSGNGEDIWDGLYAACLGIAREEGLKTQLVGDYIDKEGGRTLYVGSKRSDVFVRLYEKGKQLAGATRDLVEAAKIPRDWCRLEVQVRPQNQARYAAASATAEQAWGYSDWSSELAHRTAALNLERTYMQHKRERDDERALAWVARQYGGLFERLIEGHGREGAAHVLWAAVAKAQAGKESVSWRIN